MMVQVQKKNVMLQDQASEMRSTDVKNSATARNLVSLDPAASGRVE